MTDCRKIIFPAEFFDRAPDTDQEPSRLAANEGVAIARHGQRLGRRPAGGDCGDPGGD